MAEQRVTDEQLTEWGRLASEATEGPWVAEYSGEQGNCVIPADARSTREAVAITRLYAAFADAAFIAAARSAVPALIAEVRASRAREAELLAERGDWQAMGRVEVMDRLGQLRNERDVLQQRINKALVLCDRGLLIHTRLIRAALTGEQ